MNLLETLNRLKWDSRYKFEEAKIYYKDRKAGETSIIYGKEIFKIGEKFLETERGYIPLHRITKIEYEGKIIWINRPS